MATDSVSTSEDFGTFGSLSERLDAIDGLLQQALLGSGGVWPILRTGEVFSNVQVMWDMEEWDAGAGPYVVLAVNGRYDLVEDHATDTTVYLDRSYVVGGDWNWHAIYRVSGTTEVAEPEWEDVQSFESGMHDGFTYYRTDLAFGDSSATWLAEYTAGYGYLLADGSAWKATDDTQGNQTGTVEPDWTDAPDIGDLVGDGGVLWERWPGGPWSDDTVFEGVLIRGDFEPPRIFSSNLAVVYQARPNSKLGQTGSVAPSWSGDPYVVDGDVVWGNNGGDPKLTVEPSIVSVAGQNAVDGRILIIHNTGYAPEGAPSEINIGLDTTRAIPDGEYLLERTWIPRGASATFVFDDIRKIWHLVSNVYEN